MRCFLRIAKHLIGYGPHFRGNFKNWEEAKSYSEGYDGENILKLALETALNLKNGSLIRTPNNKVIDILLQISEISGGLKVIDFGGAFGNLYFQCLSHLDNGKPLNWRVVEQPHYIRVGNSKLYDGKLSFFSSIKEAANQENIDVIVFSGVLQYFKAPENLLLQAIALKPRIIIIDRLPIIKGNSDVICIQKTRFPYPIRSSYPQRLFACERIPNTIAGDYRLISEFAAFDKPTGGIKRVDFKGYIFERKDL